MSNAAMAVAMGGVSIAFQGRDDIAEYLLHRSLTTYPTAPGHSGMGMFELNALFPFSSTKCVHPKFFRLCFENPFVHFK